jgi:hypothetical protein
MAPTGHKMQKFSLGQAMKAQRGSGVITKESYKIN